MKRFCALALLCVGSLAGASNLDCTSGPDFLSPLRDVSASANAAFIESMKARLEGDENQCAFAGGVWRSDGPEWFVQNVDDAVLPRILRQGIKQVSTVHALGKSNISGLLVETEQGWKHVAFRVDCVDNIRVLADVAYAAIAGKSTDCVHSVADLQFDQKMNVFTRNGKSWQRDSTASFTEYMERNQPSTSEITSGLFVRVPDEMLDLLKSEPYRAALAERKYSKGADLIFQKALQISKGDRRRALALSLMTTDLRRRGPCGALHGRRGHLVPPSMFDGEKFGLLKSNRLDALPHFFSYALTGEEGAPLVGDLASWYTRKNKASFRGIGSMHFSDGNKMYWSSKRPEYDLNTDDFYNDLGIKFGLRLSQSQTVKPSDILNDQKIERRKVELGLGTSRQPEWEAYDPNLEVPDSVPIRSQLIKREKLPEPPSPELSRTDRIQGFHQICQTQLVNVTQPRRKAIRSGCIMRNALIREELVELKQRMALPQEEMIRRGWLK